MKPLPDHEGVPERDREIVERLLARRPPRNPQETADMSEVMRRFGYREHFIGAQVSQWVKAKHRAEAGRRNQTPSSPRSAAPQG